MKLITFTLPAFWAPYLINGDETSYEAGEVNTINDWMEENNVSNCLDVSDEPEFRSFHDARHFVLPCDCLEYTFEDHGTRE